MKFFIVDDDINIIRILEEIIEEERLGDVTGYALDGKTGMNEIIMQSPDIVLVDLLMPGIDGAKLVDEAKGYVKQTKFIMISQVSTKSMIGKAYDAGIEFFISKPINKIEVTRVIRNVVEKIEMERKFNVIENIFKSSNNIPGVKPVEDRIDKEVRKIKIIFSKIGIMGEKGGDDIILISTYLMRHNLSSNDLKVKEICDELSDNPKAMEQRIRRAINKGLVNLANLGIEDYMNENFIRFSSTLYDFENVKAEMDYIRGKRNGGGKISVRKFIDNLLLHKDM